MKIKRQKKVKSSITTINKHNTQIFFTKQHDGPSKCIKKKKKRREICHLEKGTLGEISKGLRLNWKLKMQVGILAGGEGWQQNHKYQWPEMVSAAVCHLSGESREINGTYDTR